MPKFLEEKLEKEYGKGNPRVYATMNAIRSDARERGNVLLGLQPPSVH